MVMNTPVSGAAAAGIPTRGIPAAALAAAGITAMPAARLTTGHAALDALLGGGWPAGMLTELLVPRQCGAELGLLTPALAALTGTGRWVLLIAPPWIPYAPGLAWQGVAPERVLIVRARQPLDALWAMEEALRSGSCAAVIAWTGCRDLPRTARVLLQRLHLLAGRQSAWGVLVRPARVRRERSPARLRLELLSATPATLRVEVFRNGCPGATGQGTGEVTVERRH